MRLIASCLFLIVTTWAQKPSLLLLKNYTDQNVTGWLMSEKLDGVRAYWDGKQLLSRGGTVFAAPVWFTKNFPPFAIDGELWTKRNDFENIQSIVMRKEPHSGWKNITFNVFEVPHQAGGLKERLDVLSRYLTKHPVSHLKVIEHFTCKDAEHLKAFLSDVEMKGGEGVVVRDPHAPYIDKRTSRALKVKSFHDAECEVVALHEGEGKFKGMLGSFTCKRPDGVKFNIGSGLSDQDRKSYLEIGTVVTYKYQGLTQKGKPRFPVFLRVKKESN